MPKETNTKEIIKMLDIVNKIFDFNEVNQQGNGLKT